MTTQPDPAYAEHQENVAARPADMGAWQPVIGKRGSLIGWSR